MTWRIRQAVNAQGFPEVDHVELFSAASNATAHSRNFVLCPGKAYDRSPCGTGTSAKLACLAADGELAPGDPIPQNMYLQSDDQLREMNVATLPRTLLEAVEAFDVVFG